MEEFLSSTITLFDTLLRPFFNYLSIEEQKDTLPETLSSAEVNLMKS